MKKNTSPNGLKFLALIAVSAAISGTYLQHRLNSRHYNSTFKVENGEADGGSEAKGMAEYFFNARKNSVTGKMDYDAMAKSENAITAYFNNSHRPTGGLGLNWTNCGPTNVGGRTRAILFDKNDPKGNTIFVAAVSGGIWKSTNAGASWNLVNDNMASLEANCLVQDANGYIYCGTGEGFSLFAGGEGFSTEMIGGGIFVSKDDGNTFTALPSTVPSSPANANNPGKNFSYVNRIAISPCNPNLIYAATAVGLFVSGDAGTTWQHALYQVSPPKQIKGNIQDVKISNDGMVVVASCSGTGYIQYPGSCGAVDSIFANINQGKVNGKLGASAGGRIEFAISPTNSNYIYAAVANGGGNLVGVYMSTNQGVYWYNIGPGGSPNFNPYSVGGGLSDQGTYDNTMAVNPDNPGQILVGGTTLWAWQNAPNDTIGSWQNITVYSAYPGYPYYIHPDEHAIEFNPYNHNNVWVGCDGGLYQTININNLNANPPSFPTWAPMNRNYVTTQFFTVGYGPFPWPGSLNDVGVIGGTQDNGTPYVPGTVSQYPQDQSADLGGGDGGGVAISYIDPNVFFTTVHYGPVLNRGANLNNSAFPNNLYTKTGKPGKGANIDSVATVPPQGNACFVTPIALYENMYDKNTVDSLRWIADSNLPAGHTVYPISPNGLLPIPYILPKAVKKGDSIIIQNTIVSKVATGLSVGSGVWMTMQATDLSDPVIWMPIGGSLSSPVKFTDAGGAPQVHSLTWSPDGDALFAGTEDGVLFRFSNLNAVRDTSYLEGALWSEGATGNVIPNLLNKVLSYNVDTAKVFSGSSRDILSITFNPNNGNDVIVTLGNYGQTNYIYYSANALSVHPLPSWTSKQGNLPVMPVYGAAYALQDGSGNPNAVVIGTEHGVWSTPDITKPSPTWTADNGGAPNTLVCAIHQQNTPTWLCSNSGNLYMGTHGRGIWVSKTLGPLSVPEVKASATEGGTLKVYPNPMSIGGTVDYTLAKEDNLVLTIYDLQGRVVKSESLGKQVAGEHMVSIHTADYSVGEYFVSLTGATIHKTAKIAVIK